MSHTGTLKGEKLDRAGKLDLVGQLCNQRKIDDALANRGLELMRINNAKKVTGALSLGRLQ